MLLQSSLCVLYPSCVSSDIASVFTLYLGMIRLIRELWDALVDSTHYIFYFTAYQFLIQLLFLRQFSSCDLTPNPYVCNVCEDGEARNYF